MPKLLSTEQVGQYHRQGYLCPIPVLSAREAAHFHDRYLELEAALGGSPKATELTQTHMHFRWSWDLIHHRAVLDAVEDVLGENILCWASSIFPKQPHHPGWVSFHQDGTYWGLSSTGVTTAWIALTESTPANGCMRVVPGSQRQPIHPHKETWAEDNLLSRGQEIQVDVNEDEVADLVLQPGEMSLHHVNIIHGSSANQTSHRRIGFVPRYITPGVAQLQISEPQPAVLVRGQDSHHHFKLASGPPPREPLDQAVETHLRAARRHVEDLTRTEATLG
jgi:ectoine hydroxylase-related dioxygenase (phytanoyl-CoA dioxygenase family)